MFMTRDMLQQLQTDIVLQLRNIDHAYGDVEIRDGLFNGKSLSQIFSACWLWVHLSK